MPNSSDVREALATCPFIVVSDILEKTDTSMFAHVRLPAQAWGEKDGSVTNSERCISRQRAFLPTPGDARPDWRIVTDVANAMGFGEAFAYRGAAEIFSEYAAMTNFENYGARVLRLGPLASIDERGYANLMPIRWPVRSAGDNPARPLRDGRFPTQDGKARFEALAARSAGVTIAGVGAALKAGTNCGSCKPEIARILAGARDQVRQDGVEAVEPV